MAAELDIVAEAEQDISQAYAWYEEQRVGLGEDFLGCVDACVHAICRGPEIHSVIHENYRRALVRRFPYAVLYEFIGGVVTIYGVFHTSRHWDKWRRRLP
jgi:plasmid stabilization system protein ParE